MHADAWSRGRLRVAALPTLLIALLPSFAACSDDNLDAVDPPVVLEGSTDPASDAGRDSRAVVESAPRRADTMVLDFSGRSPDDLLANSGNRHLRVTRVSSRDGEVAGTRFAPDGHGLRFPRYDPQGQDFAILRVRSRGPDDLLSPDRRDFAFGADVAMDDRTSGTAADNGDNLVQRGLYESSSQYKIQVEDGQLSCRVAGLLGEVSVTAAGRLEPDEWYRIRCSKQDNSVTLDIARLTESEPPRWLQSRTVAGRIGPVLMARSMPLSVGGKLSSTGELLVSSTDQFNGRVDRVYYHRG